MRKKSNSSNARTKIRHEGGQRFAGIRREFARLGGDLQWLEENLQGSEENLQGLEENLVTTWARKKIYVECRVPPSLQACCIICLKL